MIYYLKFLRHFRIVTHKTTFKNIFQRVGTVGFLRRTEAENDETLLISKFISKRRLVNTTKYMKWSNYKIKQIIYNNSAAVIAENLV